jgi:hypothetical protein
MRTKEEEVKIETVTVVSRCKNTSNRKNKDDKFKGKRPTG